MDNQMFVEINGSAQGLITAVDEAKSSLSSFGEIAGGVFAGMGAASLFSSLTSGIGNLASSIVGTASDFQSFGNTMQGIMEGMAENGGAMGNAIAGGNAKAAASALEAQDAFIKYNEKMQQINDEIATVTRGDNIVQAQTDLNDKLADLADQHLSKIQDINDQIAQATTDLAQREKDQAQAAADALQSMQETHAVKVANTKEKQQSEIDRAITPAAKASLEARFAQENKLEQDSFDREFALKQMQEQRKLDEQKKRDEEATAKHIASLEDRIARENSTYSRQEDKLRDASEKRIKQLEMENARKLALYEKQLKDEERAYQLSEAKRAAAAGAGGGGGAGRGMRNLQEIQPGDEFFNVYARAGQSMEQVQKSYQKLRESTIGWAINTPFTIHDIEQADQKIVALGLNTDKVNPIVGNLAGTFHTSFASAAQAVEGAISGYPQMLKYQFGISYNDLVAAAGGPIKSQDQLLKALEKVEAKKGYTKGIEEGLKTLPGAMSNVEDRIQLLMAAFMGLDATGNVKKGGLFDTLLTGATNFAKYLQDHHTELEGFFTKLGQSILTVGKFFSDNKVIILAAISTIGLFIANTLAVKAVSDIGKAAGAFGNLLTSGLEVEAKLGKTVLTTLADNFETIGLKALYLGDSMKAGTKLALDFASSAVEMGKQFAIATARVIAQTTATVAQNIWSGITTAATWAWTAAQTALNIVLSLNPIGLVVIGIALLVAGIVLAYNRVGWFRDLVNTLWKDMVSFASFLKTEFLAALHGVEDTAGKIGNALQHMNPLKPHSPPLVEDVKEGVRQIKASYAELQNIAIPSIGASYALASGAGNYNQQQNFRTSNVTMTNTFNVNSQANANNVAEYMGFQLEHKGLV